MNMLDYQKEVLEKVSFDQELFTKELNKSHQWLNSSELSELFSWVSDNFKQNSFIVFNKVLTPDM